MTDLWTEASFDHEAEAKLRRLTAARIAFPHWSFLAGATSQTDYENRKALVGEGFLKAAEEDFDLARSLEESIDADWNTLHGAKLEAEARARVMAEAERRRQVNAAFQAEANGSCKVCGKEIWMGDQDEPAPEGYCLGPSSHSQEEIDKSKTAAGLDNLGDAKAPPFGKKDEDDEEGKEAHKAMLADPAYQAGLKAGVAAAEAGLKQAIAIEGQDPNWSFGFIDGVHRVSGPGKLAITGVQPIQYPGEESHKLEGTVGYYKGDGLLEVANLDQRTADGNGTENNPTEPRGTHPADTPEGGDHAGPKAECPICTQRGGEGDDTGIKGKGENPVTGAKGDQCEGSGRRHNNAIDSTDTCPVCHATVKVRDGQVVPHHKASSKTALPVAPLLLAAAPEVVSKTEETINALLPAPPDAHVDDDLGIKGSKTAERAPSHGEGAHVGGTGNYRVEVTGVGENVWSANAISWETEDQARRAGSDLMSRWMGADMMRVVPESTPRREKVDFADPLIIENHRRTAARVGPGPQSEDQKCSRCAGKGWIDPGGDAWPANADMPNCPECKGTGIKKGAAREAPTCPSCGSAAVTYSKAKLYDGKTSKCSSCGHTFDQAHAYDIGKESSLQVTAAVCEGCGKDMNPVEAMGTKVCMDCTRARAKTVANNGRCTCGSKKVPGEEITTGGFMVNVDGKKVRRGGRSWIPCKRCLGTIKQTG